MKRRVLLTLVIAAIAICGAIVSYAFLTELWAVVSIAAIFTCTGALLYLVWSPKRDKAATPNFGIAAVGSIVTLSSGPIWSGLLKAYSSDLKKVGIPAQYLDSFAREFFATTLVGIFAIVIIVWLLRKDDTISGRQVGDVSKDIGEIGFKEKLERIAGVLRNRLDRLDEESNWTDEAFNPLDAEIEKLSITGSRTRKLGDLVTSIRREHRAKGFLVLGDPGSGKSVAMRHLARQMLSEVPTTGVLPLYVNLKEWGDSDKLINSPEEADIFAFIREYFKSGGNDLIVEFCDLYLKKLLEVGRLFVIFDSFDETPVLLDLDETSDVILQFSAKIEEFMIGPHKSRCVIASRYFRRPRLYSTTELVMLEVLPLSRRKIRETLMKSNRLSLAEIDRFLGSSNQWINVVKNPFVANLVVNYISKHKGMLPTSKVEVYKDYITGRLDRLKQTLEDYKLTSDKVDHVATLIAYEMFSRSHVGLEAEISELRNWIEQKHQVTNLRHGIDVLERARLVRRSPYPAERISFVHRRFNEYFLARAIEIGLTPIDLESITRDRRDRDALVLYVELTSDDEVQRIAQFCCKEISVTGSVENNPVIDEPARLRATYSLRFLVEAFTSSKKQLIDIVADELQAFLLNAVESHRTDMLRAKIAVEAAGVLDDRKASEVIVKALLTQNYWIMETAVRASRNIQNITPEASTLITKYIWQMSEAETIRGRIDLVDLFKLNTSFVLIPSIVNIKAFALIVQWPARLFACLYLQLLYLYVLGFQAELFILSLFSLRSKPNVNPFSRIENTFTIAGLVAVIALGKSICSARPEMSQLSILNNYLNFSYTGSELLFVACVSVISISIPHIAIACYAIAYYLAVRHKIFSLRHKIFSLRSRELFIIALIGCVIVILLGLDLFMLWKFHDYTRFVFYGVSGISLFYIIVRGVLSFFRQRKQLFSTPDIKFDDRGEIEALFCRIDSSYLRSRLVRRIENYHRKNGTKPNGQWSAGAAPNLFDRASIRLSQLDEIWTGLER